MSDIIARLIGVVFWDWALMRPAWTVQRLDLYWMLARDAETRPWLPLD